MPASFGLYSIGVNSCEKAANILFPIIEKYFASMFRRLQFTFSGEAILFLRRSKGMGITSHPSLLEYFSIIGNYTYLKFEYNYDDKKSNHLKKKNEMVSVFVVLLIFKWKPSVISFFSKESTLFTTKTSFSSEFLQYHGQESFDCDSFVSQSRFDAYAGPYICSVRLIW